MWPLTHPGGPDRADDLHRQRLVRTHRDRVSRRRDAQHKAWLAVRSWSAETQPAPLADRELMRPRMLADLPTLEIHDVAWSATQLLFQESRCVAVGYEADVVTVRLVRDCETPIPGLGADLGLERTTERKIRPTKLINIEHAQHVRLVLGGVDGSMQLYVIACTDQPGVVAGADGVKTERDAAVQNG